MTTEELLAMCKAWHEVGSRVTCKPPPMDTDRDVLCVVAEWNEFLATASQAGFVAGGSVPVEQLAPSNFASLRRDQDNLIVTDSDEFATRFLAATKVCRRLNLLDKSDRIAVFQAVLYGNGDWS
jgi:hypothetical protein